VRVHTVSKCWWKTTFTGDQILPFETTSRRLVPDLKQAGYRVNFQEFDGPHAMPPEIARGAIEWFLK
jgi:enterochelin esterase-like enzyme